MNAVPNTKPVSPNRASSGGGKNNPYSSLDDVVSNRDWNVTDVDAGDLQLLIAACIAAGDAIMFSASKKGPIIGVTIYHNGEPVKKWTDGPELFSELIGKLTRLALSQVPVEVQQKLTTSK